VLASGRTLVGTDEHAQFYLNKLIFFILINLLKKRFDSNYYLNFI